MKINEFVKPSNLNHAYELLLSQPKAALIAGGLFLRMQKRSIPLVIDLSNLGLDYIKDDGDVIRIGAMTSLRTLEVSELLPKTIIGSVKQIAGVGARNMATIGGSVCGRYPFSDIDTSLLALDAKLKFYDMGEVSIEDFLTMEYEGKDILTEIIIPKVKYSNTLNFKRVYTDFSTVNVSISELEGTNIAIGARPGKAVLLKNVDMNMPTEEIIKTVEFKDDYRGTANYRRGMAISFIDTFKKEMGV